MKEKSLEAEIAKAQKATKKPKSLSTQRKGFHPKRFLKGLQTKLQESPYLYLLFCFLVPVILCYGIYIVKGIYPFYNGSPLVLDLNHQYVSFFEALRDAALGERSFLYSFSRSLGGEFMGMIAYYMASPLTYLTVLFPKDRIQEAVLTIMLIKCGLSGASFGFYLHKKSKNPKKLAVFTFSLLYALSAYAIVHQHNTMWIDALIWLPLFAYGLENLVYRKKYKLYVISLSVIMICNYYIGFMVCIFAVLYFFYCYFSKSKEEINPHKEKLHFLRAGARFTIFSLVSAAISAFMLIAALYSLRFGKTEFSSPSWALVPNFDIVDFLTKFLPGAYDTVEPSGLPFVYCGIITLLLLPVYFLSRNITSREKIASLALIGVLILSLFLKPLDLIWHGFSMPNWLNARYSFILCFVLLVIAYKAFGNLQNTSEKFLLGTAAFIILFVAVAEKFEMKSYLPSNKKLLTLGCIWFSIAFTIIITVLLCLKVNKSHKKRSRAISAVLAAVICAELFCNGIVCILYLNKDVGFTTYTRYYEHVNRYRPVVSAIKEQDSSFYRMEKDGHRTKNDNMALGIYGLTNSTSTLNQKAIDFISKMGYVGRSHGTMYKGGTAVTDSLFGIKYLITNAFTSKYDNIYEKVESIENEYYSVYKNPNALSIAYGVSEDIKEFDLANYQLFFDRYNSLLTAMTGSEEKIDLFKPTYSESIYTDACQEEYSSLYTKYVTSEITGSVTFDYIAPETGYYYFYTVGSATNQLEVYFNGGATTEYLGKDSNHIVLAGYFEEGENIAATVTIPANTTFTRYNDYFELWYITPEEYNEIFTTLKEGPQFNISSDESTEDHLVGTISTSNEEQTILTTIPYDKGWNVYVDGERVETYETLGALMAFDIDEDGDHTLEMKYWPREYTLGLIVSIFGIIAFVAICTADFVLKKTLLKNRLKVYEKDYFILADYDTDDSAPPTELIESNLSHDDNALEEIEDESTSNGSDGNEEN